MEQKWPAAPTFGNALDMSASSYRPPGGRVYRPWRIRFRIEFSAPNHSRPWNQRAIDVPRVVREKAAGAVYVGVGVVVAWHGGPSWLRNPWCWPFPYLASGVAYVLVHSLAFSMARFSSSFQSLATSAASGSSGFGAPSRA